MEETVDLEAEEVNLLLALEDQVEQVTHLLYHLHKVMMVEMEL